MIELEISSLKCWYKKWSLYRLNNPTKTFADAKKEFEKYFEMKIITSYAQIWCSFQFETEEELTLFLLRFQGWDGIMS